jgi:NSS family neurotransmitter:Na+ symporter
MLIILALRSMSLPGAGKGLEFYIIPDWGKVAEQGVWNTIYAALAQAVFTLSIGIGSMAIFGSYASKEKRLTGEAVTVTVLDTVSAYVAGLIIFPACFAFGIKANAGPGLVFITLPNVFNHMSGGGVMWGTLFFVFLLFAGVATVIAVFENIIAVCHDWFGWSRAKAAVINCVIIIVISMPCILGFNLWSGFQPFGIDPLTGDPSNFLDLEDFILSYNLLPIGCLLYILYCCSDRGWGWKNFIAEVNTGDGLRFPEWPWWRIYLTWIAPIMIIVIFVMGYLQKFNIIN